VPFTKEHRPGGVVVVDSSRQIVLICGECGDKVVLGDPESVWHSAITIFECECGQVLTLAQREDENWSRGRNLVKRQR
jgi:hypothetical protein